MDESKRLITSWVRIKHWLSENFPETLENLYSPAFESQIDAAEATIGIRFPDALKTLLLEHNGEDHHWPPGIFPDGHRFLPTEDIVETWYQLKEFHDTTPENWLPISTSRSKAIRFLDFNPPQGGHAGQVVQVDFNQQTYDVLADSFVDYIEMYAMDLGVNKYAVIGDDILLNHDALSSDLFGDDALSNETLNDDISSDEMLNEEILNEALLNDDSFDGDILDIELSDPDFEDIDLSNTAMPHSTIMNNDAHSEVQHEVNGKVSDEIKVESDIKRNTQRSKEHEASSTINRTAPQVQNYVLDEAQNDEPTDALNSVEPEVPVLQSTVQPIVKEPAKQVTKQAVKQHVKQSVKQPEKQKVKVTPAPAKPVVQQARRDIEPKPAKPQEPTAKPVSDRFESGERLIIVGEMASLMGKEEMLFTVETEQAKEYTFLAKASFTKGFEEIGLDQYVRVLAKKFHGEIKSHFIDQGLAKQPEYVAFDYVVLPVEKPSAHKVSLPPPENLDEIAHSILQSIKTSIRRGVNYHEVKPEQSPQFHSKFYTENTEKLLKLGFHYTADLANPTAVKGAQDIPPYFRVMSFFDDGVVASFYHIKPRITWPFQAARKIVEFETELSDGNIIISTTAEDDIEYPLPKTISRYVHPPSIPIEGLLHKHRSKIRRYQTHKPEAAIVKVRSKKEFIALRQRRQQLIYNHLKSIGWVTKEYVAKHFNNKEVAEQVYARIKQFAGTEVKARQLMR